MGSTKTTDVTRRGNVAGRPVLRVEKFPEEWIFGFGEQSHIDGGLASTQNRAQGHDQQSVEVVQGGVAAPRVFQVFEAGNEPIRGGLPGV